MFSIFTCVMSRATHSEPGSPMGFSEGVDVRRMLELDFGHDEKLRVV